MSPKGIFLPDFCINIFPEGFLKFFLTLFGKHNFSDKVELLKNIAT